MQPKDPGDLLSQFVDVLMEMAKKKYEACVKRYEHILIMMDGLLERKRSRMESITQFYGIKGGGGSGRPPHR